MSFKRQIEGSSNIHIQTMRTFRGCHYNYGKTDQPPDFSFACDFDFHNQRPELRDGCAKSGETGYPHQIDALFPMGIFNTATHAVIQNGVLSIVLVSDALEGRRRFYTWGDVFPWTFGELSQHTVQDLLEGR